MMKSHDIFHIESQDCHYDYHLFYDNCNKLGKDQFYLLPVLYDMHDNQYLHARHPMENLSAYCGQIAKFANPWVNDINHNFSLIASYVHRLSYGKCHIVLWHP